MKPVLIMVVSLFFVLLSGCAQQAVMPPLPETALTTIAKDASGQLVTLYLPAQTHLLLKSDEGNIFGKRFKSQLRNSGYALHEFEENTIAVPKSGGKPLTYVLDALTDMSHYGYYRLTLTIGDAQLSRLYDANDVSKPNYWSYRQ